MIARIDTQGLSGGLWSGCGGIGDIVKWTNKENDYYKNIDENISEFQNDLSENSNKGGGWPMINDQADLNVLIRTTILIDTQN